MAARTKSDPNEALKQLTYLASVSVEGTLDHRSSWPSC